MSNQMVLARLTQVKEWLDTHAVKVRPDRWEVDTGSIKVAVEIGYVYGDAKVQFSDAAARRTLRTIRIRGRDTDEDAIEALNMLISSPKTAKARAKTRAKTQTSA